MITQNCSLEILLLQKMEEPESHGGSEKKREQIGWLASHCITQKNHPRKGVPTKYRNTKNKPVLLNPGGKRKYAGVFGGVGVVLNSSHLSQVS